MPPDVPARPHVDQFQNGSPVRWDRADPLDARKHLRRAPRPDDFAGISTLIPQKMGWDWPGWSRSGVVRTRPIGLPAAGPPGQPVGTIACDLKSGSCNLLELSVLGVLVRLRRSSRAIRRHPSLMAGWARWRDVCRQGLRDLIVVGYPHPGIPQPIEECSRLFVARRLSLIGAHRSPVKGLLGCGHGNTPAHFFQQYKYRPWNWFRWSNTSQRRSRSPFGEPGRPTVTCAGSAASCAISSALA